ncbi:carboxyl-terminal processing protease [Bacillus mesophilus]|uniref:C-terminal processing peptidase n=1 Tax=Bacillus mesophilus TaxID=1808955 RepID=A0A6M0Q7C7_9BACI|nr:S41 family peptidase [Bacillus mesophilus]MBM7661566.1 carboxyl-terminal processing protease [Bacillus mesophilus]NEY72235.1 PDZ domain-containing protein [Bacillus mesophilus]
MNKRITALAMAVSLIVGSGATYFVMDQFGQSSSAGVQSSNNVASDQPVAEGATVTAEGIDKIKQAYELIAGNYVEEVDGNELIEGAIQGMISTLEDPYSVYMDKETAEQFSQTLESSFEGIGAEVSMVDGKVTIVAPFKDSPAEKAGLKPNDQVIKVDGESIEGLDLYEAVLKIRGEKGTTVNLDILRPGTTQVMTIPVVRDEIPLETVYPEMKEFQGKKVGFIEVTSFGEDTAPDFEKAVKDLEGQGMEGLVIDVRGNPGGYLQSVEQMLKLFITKDKPYVQIEQRNGEKERYFSSLTEKKPYPINVLIDEGSASASEILAGAMKEAGGYDIIGKTSFGKGTVQQAVPMGDGSNIKLTYFKWLTSDGNWIHEVGVEPTIPVEQPSYFYSNPISIEEDLKYDMNNEQVKNAQVMLKGLGFEPGREDGYYSKETETAVKAFQQSVGIEQTGVISKETAGKLQQTLIEKVRDVKNDRQLETALKSLFK